jgi:hypothetical protein
MNHAEYEAKYPVIVRESTTDRIAIVVSGDAPRQVHLPMTPKQCLQVAKELERIGLKYAETVEGCTF